MSADNQDDVTCCVAAMIKKILAEEAMPRAKIYYLKPLPAARRRLRLLRDLLEENAKKI